MYVPIVKHQAKRPKNEYSIGNVMKALPYKKSFVDFRDYIKTHDPDKELCFCMQGSALNWCDEYAGRRPCRFSYDNPRRMLRKEMNAWLDGKISRSEFARAIVDSRKVPLEAGWDDI